METLFYDSDEIRTQALDIVDNLAATELHGSDLIPSQFINWLEQVRAFTALALE